MGYGDVTPGSKASKILSVVEAGIGLGTLAVIIGYLPVLYQAFSQREMTIGMFDARAGSPPTGGELVRRMADALGRDIPVAQVPRWIISAAGTFVPIMREMREMLYQWDEPFIVDDRRFRERFGAAPADVNRAAADTVAWARAHYGA